MSFKSAHLTVVSASGLLHFNVPSTLMWGKAFEITHWADIYWLLKPSVMAFRQFWIINILNLKVLIESRLPCLTWQRPPCYLGSHKWPPSGHIASTLHLEWSSVPPPRSHGIYPATWRVAPLHGIYPATWRVAPLTPSNGMVSTLPLEGLRC